MLNRVGELMKFREAATWRDAGELLLLQTPLWACVLLWVRYPSAPADYFGLSGPARRLVPDLGWVVGGVLAAKLLKVVAPALINSWAGRRWGGPTARTDCWMAPAFYLVTILDELLQVAAGVLVFAFLMELLSRSRPQESADFRFWRVYYLLCATLVVLGWRAAVRLKETQYVGR